MLKQPEPVEEEPGCLWGIVGSESSAHVCTHTQAHACTRTQAYRLLYAGMCCVCVCSRGGGVGGRVSPHFSSLWNLAQLIQQRTYLLLPGSNRECEWVMGLRGKEAFFQFLLFLYSFFKPDCTQQMHVFKYRHKRCGYYSTVLVGGCFPLPSPACIKV